MWPHIEILLLGPLTITRNSVALHVGGRKAKTVLGALVVGVNHAVSADQLAWAVWGDHPPHSVENSIQTYVSRLRHLLGPDSISIHDHSYQLQAGCEQIDSCRFERLVSEAELLLTDDPSSAEAFMREALGLWRGAPFGDLGDEEWAYLESIRLREVRLNAIEVLVEAELAQGHALEAVPRLRALALEYPEREKFWHLLIRALAETDRRPEAVKAYDEYCEALRGVGLEAEASLDELMHVGGGSGIRTHGTG